MVVIAIMGLLATVVAVNVVGHVGQARMTKVASDMESIKKGIGLYKISTGRYPARFEGPLGAAAELAPSGTAPYLDDVPPTPKDPWGHEYTYTPPTSGSEFLITSLGEGEGRLGPRPSPTRT